MLVETVVNVAVPDGCTPVCAPIDNDGHPLTFQSYFASFSELECSCSFCDGLNEETLSCSYTYLESGTTISGETVVNDMGLFGLSAAGCPQSLDPNCGPPPTPTTEPACVPTAPPGGGCGWFPLIPCAVDSTVRLWDSASLFFLPTNNTPDACIATCSAHQHAFAGVEDAQECWCGDRWTNDHLPDVADPDECDMPCTGDPDETCGEAFRIQVYALVDELT
ncbi:WSC-domain-containing protein [Punctularia strigosozonata HHB-11173 SS5]|uniref:WSC-domain-containing protein n=1 Tax=Punctularia strigosozonata (strain HHB-11173) TaxID=741275 RepID=R7S1U7_PUNST|nr:WSC-domain-containing protein [Punctularia strigosozonata HHB-11173 SS5]EIN04193.1 WSC-domain-containing protein [Punctularia strigosozonata HHB-11173 SS5]